MTPLWGVPRGRVVQQKLFRIEQMARDHSAPATRHPAPALAPHAGGELTTLKRELAHLRDAFARNARELSALLADGKEHRMTRAAGELGAAVDAMEKAADRILQSAEFIDDSAKTLASAPLADYERGLAQDIQEHVVHIFEACNFQDVSGQRIGKVIETLGQVEENLIAQVRQNRFPGRTDHAPPAAPARELVNGPRLDGEAGHASQDDIDLMFD